MFPQLAIDRHSDEPPFEQLRRQIAAFAADGTLEAGARIPTVRALAAELDLAVNTVAKSYRALEVDGVIETRGRRGTFIRSTERVRAHHEGPEAADAYVLRARRAGLSLSEALRLVEDRWTADR